MSVSRGTATRLRHLSSLIFAENDRQNLIAKSTVADFYRRHIADALQLLPLLKDGSGLDIGSGAGLPGLVIACAREAPIALVEPRRLRADFLARAAADLGLINVTVIQSRIESVQLPPPAWITARAVMPLDGLFGSAACLANPTTRWVLPKGRSAEFELAAARLTWQGRFRLVESRTDRGAFIVVAEDVRKRED